MILGQTAGELPIQGKIFAVKASNGEKAWEFNTIKNDPKSWGASRGSSAAAAGG